MTLGLPRIYLELRNEESNEAGRSQNSSSVSSASIMSGY